MDVVGPVGAIIGIVDVATRSVSALSSIRRRFMETELIIDLLTAQLIVVITALDQIHAFIEEELSGYEPHYDLIMKLEVVLRGCKLLVDKIEDHIPRPDTKDRHDVSFVAKVKLALEDKVIEECLTRLDRQINGLNLVITAFNW